MPKLIRKSKHNTDATGEEKKKENNNNDNHDHDGGIPLPKYEDLNPRYAADTTSSTTTLSNMIHSRIGSYIEEPWTIIGSYFEGKHLDQLVRHQIESYNDMVNVQLKRTIDMFNPVRIASDQDYDKTTNKYRLEIESISQICIYRAPKFTKIPGPPKSSFLTKHDFVISHMRR